jgi:hypothetical protein
MELVVLPGHYRPIAGVLFAFDAPIPEGERAPFRFGAREVDSSRRIRAHGRLSFRSS